MVSRWREIRDVCYRLYVEEKKSLDEVVEYVREHHNFGASRRSFQGAFSRWGFSKQNPAYKNEQLVARVKELWERNLTQKAMVSTLREEGYDVSDREVTRIRSRNKWLIRSTHGYPHAALARSVSRGRSESAEGAGGGDAAGPAGQVDQDDDWNYGAGAVDPVEAQVQEETLDAMREARREYRKRVFEMESHQLWLAKKRRRRTKPYAGLPPDPPGPPRFPSETTLAEAKEILQLDPATYKAVRDTFHGICTAEGVYKKTLVGPERWEALKDQLVRETMHLRAVMWDPADADKKRLAIEVIACDVTKRIRVENTTMLVGDAKVVLGLNPEEGRAVRGQLYNLLALEKFTSKHEEGIEYFETLKQRWIAGSEELTRAMAAGTSDPDYQRKVKAINVLCRDATRRYRDDVFRLGKTPVVLLPPEERPMTPPAKPKPASKKRASKAAAAAAAAAAEPAAEPAATSLAAPDPAASESPAPPQPAPSQPKRRGRPLGSRNKRKSLPHTASRLVFAGLEDGPADQPMADPPLGQPSVPAAPEDQVSFGTEQYAQSVPAAPQPQAAPAPAPAPAAEPAPDGIAAFFRLSPAATMMFPGVQTQWIAPLSARTMAELRGAALQKTPGGLCYRIEGIVKDGKGGELPLPVSDEAELETYLQHVLGSAAPTFKVHVVPGEDQTWA